MGLLKDLLKIVEDSKMAYEELRKSKDDFKVKSRQVSTPNTYPNVTPLQGNALVHCDNLIYMQHLLETGYEGKLNLIYIDPPFFSNADYSVAIKMKNHKNHNICVDQKAYTDVWDNGMKEYLSMIAIRLFLMKDLLCESGSIFVHLDWHCNHYVKIIMDEIFGQDRFVNEIIWQYKSGGVSNRYFARKHDTILFYAKTQHYYFQPQKEKSYNRGLKPYRFKGVKEYEDEKGWHTMVNMRDVWEIDMVGRTAKERTGYATQKPKAMMRRILESCTKEGDLCADFFSGSGTLASTAIQMGRRFLACDAGALAILKSHQRLTLEEAEYVLVREGQGGQENVHIKVKSNPQADKNQGEIQLRAIRYDNFNILKIDKKHTDSVQSLLDSDFSQLIAYWCIDTAYNGEYMKPDIFFFSENQEIPMKAVILAEKDATLAVKVIDVFGNEALHIQK